MEPENHDHHRHDVIECLCIHGIGVRGTEPGHTARIVAECLREGVQTAGGRFTPLPALKVDDTEPRDHDQRLVPERARVQLGDADVIVRFHDLAWHQLIDSPRLRDVFWWALRIAPLTPMLVASAWYQDRTVEDRISGRWWHRIDRVMSTCLVLVAGLVALLVIIPAGLLAGLLSIPFARVRERFRRILVEVLGDAWLYRSNRFEAAVLPHLANQTRQLAGLGHPVCLIGHSQGGEIARRVSLLHSPEVCVAVGTGEAPLGMLRTLGSNPVAWLLYWAFYAAFPAFFVWMAREAFALVDTIVGTVATGVVTASFEDHASALIPVVFFLVLAALVGSTVRRPPDLGQRGPGLNVQVKSLLDPISYGSSNSRDVLRFQPASGRYGNLLEHSQYFSTTHTGLFLAEGLLGSQTVPQARQWGAARFAWWMRVLGAIATAALVAVLWLVGSARIDLLVAWLG